MVRNRYEEALLSRQFHMRNLGLLKGLICDALTASNCTCLKIGALNTNKMNHKANDDVLF